MTTNKNTIIRGYTFLKRTVYTASGTHNNDPLTRMVIAKVKGGGGGGGGSGVGTFAGGGGAEGGYAESIDLAPGSSYSITIGAGGAVTSAMPGSAGGNSSVGSIASATGGGGGVSGLAGVTLPSGGVGTGDFTLTGQAGCFNADGGAGGTGGGTGGGKGGGTLQIGQSGSKGGGGGGSSNNTTAAGGTGGAGYAIIDEYTAQYA